MTKRAEQQIDEILGHTAAEYEQEDRDAAAEEAAAATVSRVFSVRLPPEVYEAVRAAARREHLTPSALIRQWVSERSQSSGQDDLRASVAALRRDLERLDRLTQPA